MTTRRRNIIHDQLYQPEEAWTGLANKRPDDPGLKMLADYERELTTKSSLRMLWDEAKRAATRSGIIDLAAFCEGVWWFFLFPAVAYLLIEHTFHVHTHEQQLLLAALVTGGLTIYAIRRS